VPGSFFDSNVLLYLVSQDPAKADRAEALLHTGGVISVQVLNEIANVARRKAHLSWRETHSLLELIRDLLRTDPVTLDTHDAGLAMAERYGLSIYDALIVGAALHAGCDILWSEDMQNGLLIDRRLRVRDPFV
jgi:predicted nucleic acid-binding protein